MLVKLKSFYRTFFPARQLLIRQNGEVKHLILAPWVQLTTLLVVLTALVWLSVSTLQIISQADKMSQIEQTQLSKQQEWQKQYQQQQAIYTKQLEQLAVLEQKQALLQSMIESLPESMNKPALNNEAEPILLPIQENADEFHAPLEDEQLPAQAKQYESASMRITRLNKSYDYTFNFLDQQIKQRHEEIIAMLEGAGLDSALARSSVAEDTDTAQGGPLDLFDESKIPSQFLAIADKLLALNNLENLLSELPQTLPAADYYISSSYGLRKDPMNGRRAFHKGVDLAGWHKTEIFAPADGTVLRAGRNGGYGNFIELQHKNGFVTRFGHLNKIKVKKGQTVTKDDVIGLMGSTGRSTSTHLHYEVLVNGKHVNPVKITKALSRVR
ncbi:MULTISPECIES: M23 family metallopeptidase [Pseudoalteromonas]|nr:MULTISPECIES: M23 family metallopeptidase [Pseudoalteromonas]EWH07750.1 peptidase M23 [Pseudoalteromonas lipolytica SCSIO 04301]MCC9659395.1 M23 family metallopeptidase [Pseudoalteromonas sp. MB41]QLJ09915.1 M23 family metallopeptidase [Pseudoalteromonas sp. JSTW]QMW13585.1 M23 family metallopeptidase [Pseudoalteromonas sp. MT33b]